MKRLISILFFALVITGCQTAPSEKEPTKPKAQPEPAAKTEAPAEPAVKPVSELVIPAKERLTYRSAKSVAHVYNGMGWRGGADLGSAYVIEGSEMAIYSPNDYTGELKALTLNIISYDQMNGQILVKIGKTKAFGSGALNNFWISVPYAKGLIIAKGTKLKALFGLPAGSRQTAFGPLEIHEDITEFTLDKGK